MFHLQLKAVLMYLIIIKLTNFIYQDKLRGKSVTGSENKNENEKGKGEKTKKTKSRMKRVMSGKIFRNFQGPLTVLGTKSPINMPQIGKKIKGTTKNTNNADQIKRKNKLQK